MKKTYSWRVDAIIGTFIVLLCFSHLIWTMREFYTLPAVKIDPKLAPGTVRTMLQWNRENHFIRPTAFSFDQAIHNLLRPWKKDTRKVELACLVKEGFYIGKNGKPLWLSGGAVIYSEEFGVASFNVHENSIEFTRLRTAAQVLEDI